MYISICIQEVGVFKILLTQEKKTIIKTYFLNEYYQSNVTAKMKYLAAKCKIFTKNVDPQVMVFKLSNRLKVHQ